MRGSRIIQQVAFVVLQVSMDTNFTALRVHFTDILNNLNWVLCWHGKGFYPLTIVCTV